MGYTLVTHFSDESFDKLHDIMRRAKAENCNNIPFGRNCDRQKANEVLPLHITMFHWAKQYDEKYLPMIEELNFTPSRIKVNGTQIMYAEEGSSLLYFSIEPDEGFAAMVNGIYEAVNHRVSDFLHMTIAVDKDHEEIRKTKERIDEAADYPFTLDIAGLMLYHIWKPVKQIKLYK